jgi:hypothetical protein
MLNWSLSIPWSKFSQRKTYCYEGNMQIISVLAENLYNHVDELETGPLVPFDSAVEIVCQI